LLIVLLLKLPHHSPVIAHWRLAREFANSLNALLVSIVTKFFCYKQNSFIKKVNESMPKGGI